MCPDLSLIVRTSEALLFELKNLRRNGPLFTIVHRFHKPGTECLPGEEVAAIYLLHGGREYLIPLSLTLRLMFDYMAKRSRVPQSASQIHAGFRADPFYRRHGANAGGAAALRRQITRSEVRVYVERIRKALAATFRDANLTLDPHTVLLSQETVMNEVGYCLKGSFQWVHVDHPASEFSYVR
jgi:hypothetical protein